jgi:hypothetical protein
MWLQNLKVPSPPPSKTIQRLPGQITGRRSSLTVLPDSDQREVTVATIIMGRPIQGHHPDQRCCLPDLAASQGKNDGGTPRHTGAIAGGYSGIGCEHYILRGQVNKIYYILWVYEQWTNSPVVQLGVSTLLTENPHLDMILSCFSPHSTFTILRSILMLPSHILLGHLTAFQSVSLPELSSYFHPCYMLSQLQPLHFTVLTILTGLCKLLCPSLDMNVNCLQTSSILGQNIFFKTLVLDL